MFAVHGRIFIPRTPSRSRLLTSPHVHHHCHCTATTVCRRRRLAASAFGPHCNDRDCRLVHGDLSEYNLLYHQGKLYVIDVSQSMEQDHPHALDFLRMDCRSVIFSPEMQSSWHVVSSKRVCVCVIAVAAVNLLQREIAVECMLSGVCQAALRMAPRHDVLDADHAPLHACPSCPSAHPHA
jgi:RIO1 family